MSPRPGTRGPRPGGYDHNRWLDLVEVTGPFLSVPVLRRAWPAGLDPIGSSERATLRTRHADYFDVPPEERDRDEWIRYVLTGLLGWGDRLQDDPEAMKPFTLEVPEHGETITPTFALTSPDGAARLLGLVSEGHPTGRITGSAWSATPADRLAQLLRRHDVPLGLATDGRWWVLVRAPHGKATTQAAFDASLWREERDLARAFFSLLGRARFFGVPDEETLPALLDKSQEYGEEITEALGVQVRRAVELLIGAIGQAEEETRRHRPDILPLDAHEAYVAAVTVMMRLVFLLFAEDRHLLPNDDPVYQAYYSASRLVDELEARAAEPGGEAALQQTDIAWHRLLALFRAVHGGVSAGTLQLPPYDGSLFDPDAHPWLEGRFHDGDDHEAEVLRIDDRTVMHMLRAIQYVEVGTGKGRERRRLTFASLDVEQIGYVYEGLLGFDAFRADDVVLGLTGRPGEEEEVPLTDLEDLFAAAVSAGETELQALAGRLSDRYKDSGIGSPSAVAKKLAPLADDEKPDARRRLLSATANDAPLTDRLLTFYGLLRLDLSGLPTVFRKGTLYVTQSPLRRFTGTHYTPRFLAEQVVEGALEPLVYSPGPLQTADTSKWKLRPSSEILGLKIADIAMGSAAFLVASARYLGDRLIEAWAAEGDERARQQVATPREADEVIDTEADPVVIEARRLIIEHCLYGADINPMAVEMAKLSFWLVSMDPARPFTFVDDKLATGDSLLGITSLEQLEWMHLDPKRGRQLHEDRPWAWTKGATDLAIEVAALRERIARLGDSPANYARKRELLGKARDLTFRASMLASLVVGAGLATAARKHAAGEDPFMTAANLARIAAEQPDEGWDRVRDQTDRWLHIDHVSGSFPRTALHWALAFPEVFLEKEGFDAVVGNPPFLGGPKLTGALGAAYREYIVQLLAHQVRGSADLVAYFLLRMHALLNSIGQIGVLATNTIAQGDTREVGLDQVVAGGTEIRKAIKSKPWPSKSAVLEYAAIWTSRHVVDPTAERRSDGVPVRRIAPTLEPASRFFGNPERLAANARVSFKGFDVGGMGFTMEPEKAHELIRNDRRNVDVLCPFLNGHDLNSRPDGSASRWVISFHDWPEARAKTYTEVYAKVLRDVKPVRDRNNRKVYRDYWWQYAEKRPALVKAIAGLNRVIVITLHTKTAMPAIVPTGQIFSHALAVFATEDTGMLALLSSAPHYWWAISRASTMKGDLRYTPTDVFETLPCPKMTGEMRELGNHLDTFRRELMRARQAGLTATYNLVHDSKCTDSDVAELRKIHRQIDQAVAHSYGWDNLDLGHGFHETRQGVRYTVGPVVRQEILDSLLELNHERYAAEVAAGLHKNSKQGDSDGMRLF